MKKVSAIILVLGLCLAVSGTALAQIEISEKIDIRSINKMEMYKSRGQFRIKVTVTLTNGNDRNVKFRDIYFKLRFRSGEEDLYLGRSDMVSEMIIPYARGAGEPGELEQTLDVEVGPITWSTVDRLMDIFNLLSDPGNRTFSLYMEGDGEVGMERKDSGWIYQDYKAELIFKPDIQREVLFK